MKNIIIGLAILTGSQVHAQSTAFDQSRYLTTCGGKVYAKCDNEQLNQETIYNEALQLARSSNRQLVLTVGADWCAPCVMLDKLIKTAPADLKEKFNKNFVLVKLAGETTSYQNLAAKNKWKVPGYPTTLVLNTSTQAGLKVVGSNDTYQDFISQVENAANGKKVKTALSTSTFPTSDIGSKTDQNRVRLSLLKKPISLLPEAQKYVTTDSKISSKNPLAIQYYRQGLYYLFLYNWIDSVRSLRIAIEKDPQFLEAHLAMAFAFSSLGNQEVAIGNMLKSKELATHGTNPSALALIDGWSKKYCLYLEDYCEAFGLQYKEFSREELKIAYKENERATQAAVMDIDLALLLTLTKMDKDVIVPALAKYPNHVGIHHFLVHIYEGGNQYDLALKHAEVLAQMAPKSAHAQHMLGHVLPKVNRWKDAIKQFELANEVHLQWIKENESNVEEDWHYRHNLDLLAHAYNWEKQYAKADKAWSSLCTQFGDKFCESYVYFLIAKGKMSEAESILKRLGDENGVDLAVINFLRSPMEVADMSKLYDAIQKGDGSYHTYNLYYLLRLKTGSPDLKKLEEGITSTVKAAGFDSWSTAVLRAELYASMAEKMGHKNVASNIRLIVASVGFVCKATTK